MEAVDYCFLLMGGSRIWNKRMLGIKSLGIVKSLARSIGDDIL